MDNIEKEIARIVYYTFGIKKFNTKYTKDKIIVDSMHNDVAIVLDSNLNIIDITQSDSINNLYFNKLTVLPYPFEKYEVSDILTIPNIASSIELADENKNNYRVLKELLNYVLFLNNQIKRYYSNSYSMQAIGYKMPSVGEYVEKVINRMSDYIIGNLRLHKMPSLEKIMNILGIKEQDYTGYTELINNIIYLYIDNMGLKVSEDTKQLVNVEESERVNIFNIANEILENSRKKEKNLSL